MTQFPEINDSVSVGLPRLEAEAQQKQQRKQQAEMRLRRAVNKAYAPLQAEIAKFSIPQSRRNLDVSVLRDVWFSHINKLTDEQKAEYQEETKHEKLDRLCGEVRYDGPQAIKTISAKRFTGSAWQPKHERNGGEPVRIVKAKKHFSSEPNNITSTKPETAKLGRTGTVKLETPRIQRSNRGV